MEDLITSSVGSTPLRCLRSSTVIMSGSGSGDAEPLLLRPPKKEKKDEAGFEEGAEEGLQGPELSQPPVSGPFERTVEGQI
jgi:hypothetical protein